MSTLVQNSPSKILGGSTEISKNRSIMNNWGELHGDLLNLIIPNLFGKDRLSFRLVCRHWNAIAVASPYRCSPCLMYYYWRTRAWKFYQDNNFFYMRFPELENSELRCSKYGWLLMSRYDDTLFFFDSSNNHKVELPCKVDESYYPLSFFNPPTSLECVVVGIKTISSCEEVEICTLKRGEDEWEHMKFIIDKHEQNFLVLLSAPVLHNGLIYFLSVDGDVAILDIKEQTLNFNFDCLYPESEEECDIMEQYLVKVRGEEALYGVFVFDKEREVKVFTLNSDMEWDLVEEGIGDKMFYISPNFSFGDKAPSKSMENTIYFPMLHGDSPVFYSLNDDKYHSLDGGYLKGDAYGLKRLNRAAWIMPLPAEEVSTPMSWAVASNCATI